MYYYRILAAICIGVSGGLCIWMQFNRKQKKSIGYQETLQFITRLRFAVASLETMPEAIRYAAQGTDMQETSETICHTLNQEPGADLLQMWSRMWETAELPMEERRRIQGLLRTLDMKDLSMQLKLLDRYIQRLETLTAEEEDVWRKQKGVYVKLSTMIGLLIMIVLL